MAHSRTRAGAMDRKRVPSIIIHKRDTHLLTAVGLATRASELRDENPMSAARCLALSSFHDLMAKRRDLAKDYLETAVETHRGPYLIVDPPSITRWIRMGVMTAEDTRYMNRLLKSIYQHTPEGSLYDLFREVVK